MKKLIMFFMVLALGAPALAIMVDESPPDWGGTIPRATYVWHIDTEEYGEPSCINFDTIVQDPVVFFGGDDPCYPTGEPVGTWNSDPCNGTFTFDEVVSIYVEAPQGLGSSLTIRIQAAFDEEGPGFWRFLQMFSWDEEKGFEDADWRAEIPADWEQVGETNVWVIEDTFFPDHPDIEGSGMAPPDEKAIIGFVCELETGERSYTMTGLIIDVIRHFGVAPPTTGPGRVICDDTELLPVIVDPNVMTVYEENETEGDFYVYLASPPFSDNVTLILDPNSYGGWGEGTPSEKDIVLLDGTDPCTTDNTMTLTFNAGNWNVPQRVAFKALDDDEPEPPELLEVIEIGLAMSHPTDPNFNGERIEMVGVIDNDQADILFTVGWAEQTPWFPVTGPIQIWEQPRNFFGSPVTRWREIGVTLQVPPTNSEDPCLPCEVKIDADLELPQGAENPNPPGTEVQLGSKPDLPFEETDDPNGLLFDAGNYDTPKRIRIWGIDDALLQVMGDEGYPDADGGQNYQATVVFTVVDGGGDKRYMREEPVLDQYGVPTGQTVTIQLQKSVEINIEDNECGAFGILPWDVGNPNAFTDPNYLDEDGNPLPDCYVDIYDVIEFATQWLDCSDPQDSACESYL